MTERRRAAIVALGAVTLCLACSPEPPAPATHAQTAALPSNQGSWYVTGQFDALDSYAQYTPLPDGTVLVLNGIEVEIYDPTSGLVTKLDTTENYFSPWDHTLLLRNGSVVVVGDNRSMGDGGALLFYDPARRAFVDSGLPCGGMCSPELLLPNGNVLIMYFNPNGLRVYDVASKTLGALILFETQWGSMTLLANGKILVAQRFEDRGEGLPALLFDPETGEVDESGSMLRTCRSGVRALLPDGRVLFCCNFDLEIGEPPACEYYEPDARRFVEGPSNTRDPSGGTMQVLPSGDVMILGGSSLLAPYTASHATKILRVGAPEFEPGPNMVFARESPTTLLLPSGKLFVTGSGPFVETYDPGIASMTETAVDPKITAGRASAALPDGRVLFCGIDSAMLYDPLRGTFKPLNARCAGPTALLPDGRVLAMNSGDQPTAEIIDPDSGALVTIPSETYDWGHAMALPSGSVFVNGGTETHDETGALRLTFKAELFEPDLNEFLPLPAPQTTGAAQALLGSGKLLLVGQTDPSSAGAELFDPGHSRFRLLADAPASDSSAVALPLASGDALLGSSADWHRFDSETETFEVVREFGTVGPGTSLLNGDMLFCGSEACSRYDQATGRFVESVAKSYSTMSGLVSSASGVVVASQVTLAREESVLRIWPFPPDAVRPVLDPVPERLVSRQPVSLSGSRFTKPSTVGAEAMPAFDRHPLVAFVPASGGGPVFSLVTEWTDTTLTWIPPTTTRRGVGWVHVYVDGVPSIGRFTFLDSGPTGIDCSSSAECGSGYCSEGVCCDRPCDTGCESCRAENQAPGGTNGVCAPVRGGQDPKQACAGSVCGEPGSCTGHGTCTTDGEASSCSPYACRNAECLNICEAANDCATGFGCTDGTCGRCTADGAGVERGPRSTVSCAPYRCDDGQCQTSCNSRSDCAPNHRCSEGKCVPGASFERAFDPGACSVHRASKRSGSPFLFLPAFAWLLRRRRSRAFLREAA